MRRMLIAVCLGAMRADRVCTPDAQKNRDICTDTERQTGNERRGKQERKRQRDTVDKRAQGCDYVGKIEIISSNSRLALVYHSRDAVIRVPFAANRGKCL